MTLIAKGTIEENILKWNENAATAMSSSAPAGPGDVDDGVLRDIHPPDCFSRNFFCDIFQATSTSATRQSAWRTS